MEVATAVVVGMDGEGGLVGCAGLMKVGVMMVSTLTLVMLVNVGRVGGSGRLKLYDLYSLAVETVPRKKVWHGYKWMVRDWSRVDIFGKTLE